MPVSRPPEVFGDSGKAGKGRDRIAALTTAPPAPPDLLRSPAGGGELTEVGRVAVPAVASREGWVPNAPSVDERCRGCGLGATRHQESAEN